MALLLNLVTATVTILLLSNQMITVAGQCNMCDVNRNIACLSRDTFQLCTNSKPNPMIGTFKCPPDTVCLSSERGGCAAIRVGIVASCGGNCGVCDATTSSVSCIDDKKFAFCYNNEVTTNIGTCGPNQVCNSASADICIPRDSNLGSTCPTPPPSETDPEIDPNPVNPVKFCQSLGVNALLPGRYPVKGKCGSYIYCYAFSGGVVTGEEYSCPGNKPTFSCSILDCVTGPCEKC